MWQQATLLPNFLVFLEVEVLCLGRPSEPGKPGHAATPQTGVGQCSGGLGVCTQLRRTDDTLSQGDTLGRSQTYAQQAPAGALVRAPCFYGKGSFRCIRTRAGCVLDMTLEQRLDTNPRNKELLKKTMRFEIVIFLS